MNNLKTNYYFFLTCIFLLHFPCTLICVNLSKVHQPHLLDCNLSVITSSIISKGCKESFNTKPESCLLTNANFWDSRTLWERIYHGPRPHRNSAPWSRDETSLCICLSLPSTKHLFPISVSTDFHRSHLLAGVPY